MLLINIYSVLERKSSANKPSTLINAISKALSFEDKRQMLWESAKTLNDFLMLSMITIAI